MEFEDTPIKHKKASKTSHTSKVEKRSNHKHIYKNVIIKGIIGFTWAKRCDICGRFDYSTHIFTKDFIKPEARGKCSVGVNDFYSVAELKENFPKIEIYSAEFENGDFVHKKL